MRYTILALVAACALGLAHAATPFSVDASDLWYNPAESGWGVNLAQQGDTAFLTLYVYGSDGKLSHKPPSTRAATADEPHFTRCGAATRTRSVGFGGATTPASTAMGAGGRWGAPTEADADGAVFGALPGRRRR